MIFPYVHILLTRRRSTISGGLLPEFFLPAGCDQHSYAPARGSPKRMMPREERIFRNAQFF